LVLCSLPDIQYFYPLHKKPNPPETKPANMKLLIILLISFPTVQTYAQDYPFAKNFVPGTVIFNHTTQKTGQIKWYPDPGEKLRFRENEKSKTNKYGPEELLGFVTDTLKFVSLFNLEVYAFDFALLGKTTKIKHTFGQLQDSGRYNIYFVLVSAYNALNGTYQRFPNYVFEKKSDSGNQYAAFPLDMRLKDKKFEKAKESLYIFFRDYPDITEKIKACKKEDNFLDVIDLMKKMN
jgi:hypothetical protein